MKVLVVNSGSSSIKYQLLESDTAQVPAHGIVQRIGEDVSGDVVTVEHRTGEKTLEYQGPITDHAQGLRVAFDLFSAAGMDLAHAGLGAVGHRVVHGGEVFYKPTLITDEVLSTIVDLSSLAPLHNPPNVVGIEAARRLLPGVPQVAVFDTAFFHDLPAAAKTYAIDTETAAAHGIRRYGFHGTSHEYVSGQVAEFLGRDLSTLNQIVLHLGNGASASAIRGGRAVDTSMGLTPLEGLVMGTRSGDLDPGILFHLARTAGMHVDDIDTLLNRDSGIKGLAGVNDFRELGRLMRTGHPEAQLAFDVYIHRLRHYIGAYMIDLGRVDAITFTAGVGENDSHVRSRALADLSRYGIDLDESRNQAPSHAPRRISTDTSEIQVLVIPTNEELAIARAAATLIP